MTTMELLTIPGLDNSKKLQKMQRDAKKRMENGIRTQMIAASLMSRKTTSKK